MQHGYHTHLLFQPEEGQLAGLAGNGAIMGHGQADAVPLLVHFVLQRCHLYVPSKIVGNLAPTEHASISETNKARCKAQYRRHPQ